MIISSDVVDEGKFYQRLSRFVIIIITLGRFHLDIHHLLLLAQHFVLYIHFIGSERSDRTLFIS